MRITLLLTVFIFMTVSASAQTISKEDYGRAVSFLSGNLFNKKIFNSNLQYNWCPDSSGVSFVLQDKDGKSFKKISWKTMKPEPLFDHTRLAQLLSDSLHQTVNAGNLPISNAQYTDKTHLLINARGRSFILDLITYQLAPKTNAGANDSTALSPDGKWIAYAKDHNLFVRSVSTGAVQQLSHTGTKNYEYATYYGWGEIMEGENGERPPHFAVSWSPDSKWLGTYITDFRKGQKMFLLDWSIDTLYKPKLLSYYRGSPGDTDMVYLTPVFFNIASGEELRKDEFRNVNAAGYEWAREPGVVYIENRKRGYQQVDLYRCALTNNSTDTLYTETSKTNIDNYRSDLLPMGDKIIITSEKDGWKQLYLLSLRDKKLTRITNGNFYVNDVLHVDEKARFLVFTASGKEPDRNPYFQHAYRINLDGSGLRRLTPENANHDVTVSPDGKYMTDNISAYNLATRSVLRETKTGKVISEIALADIDALLAMHFRFPEAFTCTARDSLTTIYGMIWKPTNFDAEKKYPIIDQSYTGPHTFMFPRNFVSTINRSNQALAELGFIVVCIDGMGTANRSKAFHDVSYKNMGKNLTDHVLTIRELAKRYNYIDSSRVGIFGHSAGGYDAGHAMLEFPDFYKCAVASSGDHDFRMEKDWWPEMYMGWPVDSTYNEVSNITMAKNLKGKLLLVHGGIDENVNPSATFKLAEALIKADKEFDMLIIPSQHHGYTGKFNEYFTKKKWNYFVQYLLGAEPIWDFELSGTGM